MTEDDQERYYFRKDCTVRELPESALVKLGWELSNEFPDRNWRALGGQLGFTVAVMDRIRATSCPNPGYNLLKDWGHRDGSTLRVLERSLEQIGRHDMIESLDTIRQNSITLYITLDSNQTTAYGTIRHLDVVVQGRKELWKALRSTLEGHTDDGHEFTYFELARPLALNPSWTDLCNIYLGQDVLLKVSSDRMNRNSPAKQLAPNCYLVTDTVLGIRRSLNSVHQRPLANNDGARILENGMADLDLKSCPVSPQNNPPTKSQSSLKSTTSGSAAALIRSNIRSKNKELLTNKIRVEENGRNNNQTNDRDVHEKGRSHNQMNGRDVHENRGTRGHQMDRRSHGIPNQATLMKCFPELTNLPGFHKDLGNKSDKITGLFKSYMDANGSYAVRAFISNPQSKAVQLAISAVFSKTIKHFLILSNRDSTDGVSSLTYFIFKDGHHAETISDLIEYYRRNSLIPQMEAPDTNEFVTLRSVKLWILTEPILGNTEILGR